ncbi:hypothetical protein [Sphingomonas xanthus]|nr:hypothetical protein [Sphingomonas xanthus]
MSPDRNRLHMAVQRSGRLSDVLPTDGAARYTGGVSTLTDLL